MQFCERLGLTDVNKLTPSLLRDFTYDLKDHGLQATSIRRTLSAIRTYFSFLLAEGYVTSDPTEQVDRAADEPERLAALVERWFEEAERNDVLPLDDGAVNRFSHMYVPWTSWRPTQRLRPGAKVHEVVAPNLAGGFRMVAAFTEPVRAPRGDAVLCEQGDWISGWAWYLVDGTLTWCLAGKARAQTVSAPILAGTRVLVAEGAVSDGQMEVVFTANGTEVARGRIDGTPPLAWAPDGAFLTIGYGRPFPVNDDYVPPAPAPPSLRDVSFTVGPLPPFDLEAESRVPDALDALVAGYRTTHEREVEWLATVEEGGLARILESSLIPGNRRSVSEALTQMALHAQGHRSQCATRLRQLGGTPPTTDFILWLSHRNTPEW